MGSEMCIRDRSVTAAPSPLAAARVEAPASFVETPATPTEVSSFERPLEPPAEPPDDFVCPITQELMIDPVIATDGHTYERHAIERWLAKNSTSPKSGLELDSCAVVPNHMARCQIREWQEEASSRARPSAPPVTASKVTASTTCLLYTSDAADE